MVNIQNLAENIFGLLKGHGYHLKLFDEIGTETVDPGQARRFFCANPGLMITIDEPNEQIELNKSQETSFKETDKLQRGLKRLANENLLNYTVKYFGKAITPRDFSYQAKINRDNNMQNVAESNISKLGGSKKTSHQTLENVKILVKHATPIDEDKRGARSRNIKSIFLEQHGERLRFPHNNLASARAMARHMTNGGTMSDQLGSYIIEKTEQMQKLKEFYAYARSNKLINEDTTDIIETVKESYSSIKRDIAKLAGSKTYESIKSRIEDHTEVDLIESDDTDGLKDMFTIKRFDEKYNDVLPLVSKLVQEKNSYFKRIEESVQGQVFLSPSALQVESVVEFANPSSKLGFRLSDMANRIVENDELASFITNISRKLCKESEITSFEKGIISSFLNNATAQSVRTSTGLTEAKQYGEFFDKFMYTFVK